MRAPYAADNDLARFHRAATAKKALGVEQYRARDDRRHLFDASFCSGSRNNTPDVGLSVHDLSAFSQI
jgi:hypothetical protein